MKRRKHRKRNPNPDLVPILVVGALGLGALGLFYLLSQPQAPKAQAPVFKTAVIPTTVATHQSGAPVGLVTL